MKLLSYLLCLPILVEGLYVVQVRVSSYNNPTNWCIECSSGRGCCDNWEDSICSGVSRCDTYFQYCLRPLGTPGVDAVCLGNPVATSESIWDGAEIIFTENMVLGLTNPLFLNGTGATWMGIQLFIISIDSDSNSGNGSPDDVIDTFAIDIDNSVTVGVETPLTVYNGTHGLAHMGLQYEVRCAEHYYGDSCENLDECSQNGVICGENAHCESGNSLACVCNVGFAGASCEIDLSVCDGIDCNGQSQCIAGVGTFTCSCSPGFTGTLCEINIDECIGVDCNGNGQCVDGIGGFSCDCIAGFTGTLCEMNTDECIGVTCNGTGQCMDGVSGFSCECNPGFTGSLCEMNIDDCLGVTCNGNGQCQDGVNSFSCVCNSGFTGESCESEINECIETSCSGNGYCVDQLDSFTCVCNSGFTGPLCETNIDDCVGVNCSGNGLCTDGIGEYGCVCFSGYYGINCESHPLDSEDNEAALGDNHHNSVNDHHTEIIFGSVGGTVLLVAMIIITITVVVCLYIRSRKTPQQEIQENMYDTAGGSIQLNQNVGYGVVQQGVGLSEGGATIEVNRNIGYGVVGQRGSYGDQPQVPQPGENSYNGMHVGSRRDPIYAEGGKGIDCYNSVL